MIEVIGVPAMLEQLAEECSELSQAALKLARKYRGENPTPRSEMECLAALTEEIADVYCCLDQLKTLIDDERVTAIKEQKMVRWRKRIEENKTIVSAPKSTDSLRSG